MSTTQAREAETLSAGSAPKDFNWKVTNSTDKAIVVLSGFSDDDIHSEQLYEQALTLRKAATGASIAAGVQGTVELKESFKDEDGNTQYADSFNIIIARADNLYPVKVIALKTDKVTKTFPDAEVLQKDVDAMRQAEKFKQTIMAFPSATLATKFENALSDDTITDLDAYFFQATQEYKVVTLNMVVAITTYYQVYPFAWADYKAAKDYYLYTSDGSKNTCLGSVSLDNAFVLNESNVKALDGFKMTYRLKNDSTQPLFYKDGQFIDATDTDSPSFCLGGNFILKSQLTQKQEDKDLTAYLNGVIDGAKVLGYDEKQPDSDDENQEWSGFYFLLHPHDTKDYLDIFAYAMGIILGIEFVIKIGGLSKNFIQKKWRGKNDPAALDKRFREASGKIRANMEKAAAKIKARPIPDSQDDLADDTAEFRDMMIDRFWTENERMVGGLIEVQQKYLSDMAKYGVTKEMQGVADSLEKMSKDMSKAKPAEFRDMMDELQGKLKTNTTVLNERAVRVKNQADRSTKEEISDSQEMIENYTRNLAEDVKIREYWEQEGVPEIDDFVIVGE